MTAAPPVAGAFVYMDGLRYRCTRVEKLSTGVWDYTLTPEPETPPEPEPRKVAKRMTVRHPAGTIDLGDGLEVDVELRRDALGSLIHARVPVMTSSPCRHPLDAHNPGECPHARYQVGTAVLVTYKTLMDGSAADLEFDVDLDEPQ